MFETSILSLGSSHLRTSLVGDVGWREASLPLTWPGDGAVEIRGGNVALAPPLLLLRVILGWQVAVEVDLVIDKLLVGNSPQDQSHRIMIKIHTTN